jgi:Fe-S cluster assembly ATPase SufC
MAYWYIAGAPVLDGADLTVAPGEVVMVAAPNGSGKAFLVGNGHTAHFVLAAQAAWTLEAGDSGRTPGR